MFCVVLMCADGVFVCLSVWLFDWLLVVNCFVGLLDCVSVCLLVCVLFCVELCCCLFCAVSFSCDVVFVLFVWFVVSNCLHCVVLYCVVLRVCLFFFSTLFWLCLFVCVVLCLCV